MKSFCLSLLAMLLLAANCKKPKHENPLDQLPPESQTGANTFGCLVDGEVFKPKGAQLSGGSLSCNYQFLGTGTNGGYFFRLVGVKSTNETGVRLSVGLFTDSLKIEEGVKYRLTERFVKGTSCGQFTSYSGAPGSYKLYNTDAQNFSGEIWIKKLDPINQIVSGTFWFNAVNDNGEKVEVREGRFDVRYTQ